MLLSAQDVSFSYPCGKQLLAHVDFSIAEGEIVGLVGPSGCGKSTLSQLLAGRLEPNSGKILWDNKPLNIKEFLPVQMVYQHPEQAINPRWRMSKVMTESWNPPEELQRSLGIEPAWLNRWPNELSGGEQQRFCIIRALDPRTRILICDEMSTMLDAITQAQIWEAVTTQARKREMGLLVITHNDALAQRLCDRIVDFQKLTLN